ncbi:hypothetical protein CPC08DRAFT_726164 [Agrocybe pediades]|nr:hypothetical protein CPC08DRAFT_726164 [Agrocybe pediades]
MSCFSSGSARLKRSCATSVVCDLLFSLARVPWLVPRGLETRVTVREAVWKAVDRKRVGSIDHIQKEVGILRGLVMVSRRHDDWAGRSSESQRSGKVEVGRGQRRESRRVAMINSTGSGPPKRTSGFGLNFGRTCSFISNLFLDPYSKFKCANWAEDPAMEDILASKYRDMEPRRVPCIKDDDEGWRANVYQAVVNPFPSYD